MLYLLDFFIAKNNIVHNKIFKKCEIKLNQRIVSYLEAIFLYLIKYVLERVETRFCEALWS